jgi:sucrose-6-phosphate hydrolase SacC (GH32 family)
MANRSRGHWRKCGLVFRPEGQGGWMNSHAQVPTALLLGDRIRVYFASRASQNISLTTYVDLDAARPERILDLREKPILELGGPGTFDEHGIMPAAVVADGNQVRLYYTGWSRLGGAAPYHNTTGVAVSKDGGRCFRRLVPGPVLDRAPEDPYSATSPAVIRTGNVWHTFYSSGRGWIEVEGKQEHIYDLRHATSSDGIHWRRDGVAIAQAHPEEALTRPSLWFRDGEWWMWFSYRGSRGFRDGKTAYRIGFARSTDLVHWQREDDCAGIELSETGWDSQMMAYPCVVSSPAGVLMFYNGNYFGRDGFGYAVWQEA